MPPLLLLSLALLRLVLLATARRRSPLNYDEPPEKLVFVLAGQSNMAGRGGVAGGRWDGVVPPECHPSPSILRLSAALRWEEARDPLHADIDVKKTCGVGPGMPFARALLASGIVWAGPRPPLIELVPCAVGGTRIEEWGRGMALYESMVQRAKAAGGRLGAVLWFQGESDTVERKDAEAYGGRMERLIRDLRSDLGLPDLLLIQVVLASGEGNFTEVVRQAQKGIKLANVACVDAKGLPLQDDHLHLTTAAQVQLGQMLAHAYLHQQMSKCRL